MRSALRKEYGFTSNLKRKFDVECVFSTEQPVFPKPDGTVCHAKPGVHGATLDCNFGYGSASFITANFGFIAAARAINKSLKRRLAKQGEAQAKC